jgi:hypothetical protein
MSGNTCQCSSCKGKDCHYSDYYHREEGFDLQTRVNEQRLRERIAELEAKVRMNPQEELYGRPAWMRSYVLPDWHKQFIKNIQKLKEGKMEESHFKFWYVYNPLGKQWPTVRHSDERHANAEAERLAKANPGREFMVLEAKRFYRVESPVKIVELDNPIPF